MTDDETLVADVIEHLLARDLDTVLKRYGPHSVLRIDDDATHEGSAAIRAYFVAALAAAPPGADFIRRIETDPDGRVALRWQLLDRPEGTVIARGEDHYRIERGIIVEQVVSHH